ncbi:MAG: CvpA family protein [Planctomycetaceae bacterium]|jgi:membrane protein required for colicin V production|nr:CvpA family protein [Planctomycetaceae bacterium]
MTNLQAYDFVILILIGALTLRGWMKGMISQLASLAAIIASFWASARFAPVMEPMVQANPPWNKVLAITITFIGASVAVGIVHYCLAKIINAVRIKKYDKLCGAAFGALKGVIIGMIITFFAVMLSEQTRGIALQSQSGKILANLVQQIQVMLPKDLNELIDANLEGFKKQMDSQIDNPLTKLSEAETLAEKASDIQKKLQDAWITITQKPTETNDPADVPPALASNADSLKNLPRSSNRLPNISNASDFDPLQPSILQDLSSKSDAIKTTDLIPQERFNFYNPTPTVSTATPLSNSSSFSLTSNANMPTNIPTIMSPNTISSAIDSSLVLSPSAPRIPISEQPNTSPQTIDWQTLLKNLP